MKRPKSCEEFVFTFEGTVKIARAFIYQTAPPKVLNLKEYWWQIQVMLPCTSNKNDNLHPFFRRKYYFILFFDETLARNWGHLYSAEYPHYRIANKLFTGKYRTKTFNQAKNYLMREMSLFGAKLCDKNLCL
jgi:hypothetical protein